VSQKNTEIFLKVVYQTRNIFHNVGPEIFFITIGNFQGFKSYKTKIRKNSYEMESSKISLEFL
jgi:hypothetical protein